MTYLLYKHETKIFLLSVSSWVYFYIDLSFVSVCTNTIEACINFIRLVYFYAAYFHYVFMDYILHSFAQWMYQSGEMVVA